MNVRPEKPNMLHEDEWEVILSLLVERHGLQEGLRVEGVCKEWRRALLRVQKKARPFGTLRGGGIRFGNLPRHEDLGPLLSVENYCDERKLLVYGRAYELFDDDGCYTRFLISSPDTPVRVRSLCIIGSRCLVLLDKEGREARIILFDLERKVIVGTVLTPELGRQPVLNVQDGVIDVCTGSNVFSLGLDALDDDSDDPMLPLGTPDTCTLAVPDPISIARRLHDVYSLCEDGQVWVQARQIFRVDHPVGLVVYGTHLLVTSTTRLLVLALGTHVPMQYFSAPSERHTFLRPCVNQTTLCLPVVDDDSYYQLFHADVQP